MLKLLYSILFCFTLLFSETLVLQEGENGYDGTQDVTIFNDVKAQAYSWYKEGNQTGKPDDRLLVNTEFCC